MTVKIFILFPLDNDMTRHQMMSINMRRNIRMNYFVLSNLYQKRRQCAYTLFLVHLPYCINKSIIIHIFYHPWHQHCIIWVMNMLHNISLGVIKDVFWEPRIKFRCTSSVIFLWENTKKKTKKDSIIIFRNGIHPRHMIYISESIYLSNCVFVTIHVEPD